MSGVLRTVASDHFVDTGVASKRERSLENVIARLHQHQDTLDLLLTLLDGGTGPLPDVLHQLVLDDLAGTMEEVLHHVEESGIRCLGDVLQAIRDLVVGVTATGQRCRRMRDSRRDARQHQLRRVVAGYLFQGDRGSREAPHVKHLRGDIKMMRVMMMMMIT